MTRKVVLQTPRLLLGEILPGDAPVILELDEDQLVHRFLAEKTISTIEQSRAKIAAMRMHYNAYGTGRWAIIDKQSGQFLGWAGITFETKTVNKQRNFYDLGYRLLPRFWGQGFATEAAIGCYRLLGIRIRNTWLK